MGLVSCPDCRRSVSDSAQSCIHCGRPLGGAIAAASPQVAGSYAPPVPAAPALDIASEHPYFPVSTSKFVVLSLCSLSIYEIYWCYKNWHRIKQRTGENIWPFWRAFFAPLWGFSQFQHIRDDAVARRIEVTWSHGLLATFFLILSVTWRLPDPWWLISLVSFIPFIPVVQTVREINASAPAAEGNNEKYSGANIALIIFGGLILLLAIVATLFPPEPTTTIQTSA